ncbi:lytic transglycosylase domain-containing protein [Polaromonas sp.]|uniref:lytic transglycosylase domain-containing protein n=1 Tax=Polaromonas sp. TaxID=1869339 RepID=UPI003BB69D99
MKPEPIPPAAGAPAKPFWRAMGSCAAVLVLLALHATPARADIWGYVDAERMPHFASSRLDERYELFLRDSVEPYRLMDLPAKAQDDAPGALEASSAAEPAGPAAASAISPVSPRLLAFFEHSENYKAVSPLLREASTTHGIDYSLLKALIATESGFNTFAVSPKGAVGLMQLIPPTAERYGVTAGKGATIEKKLTDPKINIKAGARYLAYLINMFPGRLELALAAYNAGEGAVQRAGNRIPNYPETRNYVKTVMQLYNGLAPVPFKTPATGRVRLEMKGGSAGRSNLPPLAESAPPLLRADLSQE